MNDFELNYLHYSRSEELMKQARNERQARELVNAAKATRRGGHHVRHQGLAARVAKALGRGERPAESTGGRGSARVQPAK
ncbi:hypothetical protein [Glycomyces tritici]|uniref:Uncharacterized protein n=1 Tax=Glycomyces tritici TaxID=2665176 RepID=A0ABT7YYC8_9ACTN|nr:hypothetical protein [Glycomyces tritici]MDN3243657.1 hypothetical protein [Glycomyces tritici]